MDDAALAVPENLDLDVPGPLEMAFQIDFAAAEERRRLALRNRHQTGQLGGVPRYLHAAPAAACAGLDQNGIPDRAGRRLGRRDITHDTRRTGNRWNPKLARRLLRRDLVAHQPDVLGGGADEGETVLLHRRGEIGVLGKKSETGMDRVGAGDSGGL